MPAEIKAAFSCVLDDKPEIWDSFLPWLTTLKYISEKDNISVHVHHVCDLPTEIINVTKYLEIHTHAVPAFNKNYPHTNKIRQCQTDYADADKVILTDVDVVFATMLPLIQINSQVAGKMVDRPNPKIDILEKIFRASGLSLPEKVEIMDSDLLMTFETFMGNFNGGVYIIDRDSLKTIGHRWSFWAAWLIDRIYLLDRWSVHVDQIAFCLAVNELQLKIQALDDSWNFPLHLEKYPAKNPPFIIHHHCKGNIFQLLRSMEAPDLIDSVTKLNETFKRLSK